MPLLFFRSFIIFYLRRFTIFNEVGLLTDGDTSKSHDYPTTFNMALFLWPKCQLYCHPPSVSMRSHANRRPSVTSNALHLEHDGRRFGGATSPVAHQCIHHNLRAPQTGQACRFACYWSVCLYSPSRLPHNPLQVVPNALATAGWY